jgi:hypothetical protein
MVRLNSNFNYQARPEKQSIVCSFIQNTINLIGKNTIYYLSAKQIIRPDSFQEIFFNIFPKILNVLYLNCRKLQSIFSKVVANEGTSYIESLSALKKILKENTIALSLEESSSLNRIFDQALNCENYLDKYDFSISSQDATVTGLHNDCKKLFLMRDDAFFDRFYSRIERLSKLNIDDEIESIEENEKLNVKDVCILAAASTMKSLAESLHKNGITGMEIFISKWSKIEMISESQFFNELKKICSKSHPTGTIFLGDRNTVDISTGRQSSCTEIFRQIFMGRICHIGIFVQPEEKGLHLSHVNGITNNHAITPVRFPLNIPFSYTLELDISSLIPKEVLREHHQILSKSFLSSFQKFAEEFHPELPLAETKTHMNMLIFGHKKIYAETLEKVQLPSKDTPIMCSSYVGIIFLKAIHEVNIAIKKLNYLTEISHPFGEHENLMNLDILRLVYLWNQLKIIREPKVHPTISKVMSSLSSLNLSRNV